MAGTVTRGPARCNLLAADFGNTPEVGDALVDGCGYFATRAFSDILMMFNGNLTVIQWKFNDSEI